MAKIKVILTEDVAGQGRKGDIISVSDGYAHNFLLKGKKAVLATDEELRRIENKRKKEEKKLEEERVKAVELKKLLESKAVKIEVKSGENGKLFGTITHKEIATLIKDEFDVDIDKKKIECNIKNLGMQEATIKLFTEIKATLKVEVLSK
ncbi:MAG: 50S ribosomal protein L9 [Fusobacterium sp.]|nr:50S ribosomal protein L9 [Fusobacterium sp.]